MDSTATPGRQLLDAEFVIMPIFALANAGVSVSLSAVLHPVATGVAAGLVLGKPLWIVLASWLAVRLGWAVLPNGVSWPVVLGAGCLAGIGFTMSLFIASLSLEGEMLRAAQGGILLGSAASVMVGMVFLWLRLPARGTRPARHEGRRVGWPPSHDGRSRHLPRPGPRGPRRRAARRAGVARGPAVDPRLRVRRGAGEPAHAGAVRERPAHLRPLRRDRGGAAHVLGGYRVLAEGPAPGALGGLPWGAARHRALPPPPERVLVRLVPGWVAAGRRSGLRRGTAEGQAPGEHVVLCRFGRVGSAVGEALGTFGLPYVAIGLDPDIAQGLRARGVPCWFGDAAGRRLLERAGVARAMLVLVALPAIDRARAVVRQAL